MEKRIILDEQDINEFHEDAEILRLDIRLNNERVSYK